jgi:YidC/Oxa1 family membrane protein insertase
MQSLAPEIAKVKAKAAGDKQKESQLLLELYKEKGISPFASLVPLLIQLPLLFAFYIVIEHAIKVGELSSLGYGWLKDLDYIKAILSDSSLFKATFFGVDLIKPNLILALLAGTVQFFQSKQIMPKNQGDDPAAKMASTSLYIVPVITVVFGMQLPAALALYWVATSAVALVQQKVILNQDVVEMEK